MQGGASKNSAAGRRRVEPRNAGSCVCVSFSFLLASSSFFVFFFLGGGKVEVHHPTNALFGCITLPMLFLVRYITLRTQSEHHPLVLLN